MTDRATFPGEPESVRAARRFTQDVLSRRGLVSAQRALAELLLSELATNAVRHAATTFTITIAQERRTIRIEVTDTGGGTPAPRNPGADETGGRGLLIVGSLADAWGVNRHDGSKTVWCTLPADTPTDSDP